jgi:RimJ/RimL family protein N-acetyltransferase
MTHLPATWLETPRLALREFVPADFDDLYRLDSDARVMRFLNKGQPLTRPEVRDGLARILAYYPHYPGLGVWRASERESDTFVGWFCLKYCPPTCDVELGYRLLPAAWSRGLATEGARALVGHAFDELGLYRVIGVTHPHNIASQRVLRKAGLRDEGWGAYYGRRVRLFAKRPIRDSDAHALSTAEDVPLFPLLRWSESERTPLGR